MEGFNDRVGKVFDCLSSSSTTASWSLSDAQIQRNTWNRNKGNKSDIIVNDDETLVSSSFDNLFKSKNNKKKNNTAFDDPDDEDEDNEENNEVDEDLDLDVRSSIGLDPTLDFEDEEDEYDKIAAGTENNDVHLLYMKDVTNHAPYLNSHNILSTSMHNASHTLTTSNNDNEDDDQPMLNAAPAQSIVDSALKVKSILKRKSGEMEKPGAKRVRFDTNCKEHDAPQEEGFPVPQVFKSERSSVPDYLINPSKYKRYTFNDDDDKKSNTAAYLDFLDQVKKAKGVGSEQKPPGNELPTSVVFIPRKKRGDAAPSNSEEQVKESSTGVGIGIADVEVQEDEDSDMVQDEPDVDGVCAKPPKFQKPGRRYRSKVEDDDSVC